MFNDFVLTSTILLHRVIARLNPKTAKVNWFFNGFLIFTFRAKIAHFDPFGPLGGLRLDLLLWTRADFQKSYKFQIDLVQNAIYNPSFWDHEASKIGVRVDINMLIFPKENSLFCIFRDHKMDINLMVRQGGHPGRPGLDPAPNRPPSRPKSTPRSTPKSVS